MREMPGFRGYQKSPNPTPPHTPRNETSPAAVYKRQRNLNSAPFAGSKSLGVFRPTRQRFSRLGFGVRSRAAT